MQYLQGLYLPPQKVGCRTFKFQCIYYKAAPTLPRSAFRHQSPARPPHHHRRIKCRLSLPSSLPKWRTGSIIGLWIFICIFWSLNECLACKFKWENHELLSEKVSKKHCPRICALLVPFNQAEICLCFRCFEHLMLYCQPNSPTT